jgi:hypothetical protein
LPIDLGCVRDEVSASFGLAGDQTPVLNGVKGLHLTDRIVEVEDLALLGHPQQGPVGSLRPSTEAEHVNASFGRVRVRTEWERVDAGRHEVAGFADNRLGRRDGGIEHEKDLVELRQQLQVAPPLGAVGRPQLDQPAHGFSATFPPISDRIQRQQIVWLLADGHEDIIVVSGLGDFEAGAEASDVDMPRHSVGDTPAQRIIAARLRHQQIDVVHSADDVFELILGAPRDMPVHMSQREQTYPGVGRSMRIRFCRRRHQWRLPSESG